jgi:hypothetical protein
MEEKGVYLMVDKKHRVTGRRWGPGLTFTGTSPVTYFLQLGPTS